MMDDHISLHKTFICKSLVFYNEQCIKYLSKAHQDNGLLTEPADELILKNIIGTRLY